jgi:N-acetylmuramoyl-L-alanine amidase
MYNANTKDRARTDFIAIHCSATSEKQDFGAADINKWHRAKGWACIGYHYVIKRDGTIEQGRKESQVGAHVADWNAVSLGICMIGGVDADDRTKAEDNFTPEQYASLKDLILELKTRYPKAKIQGHRDFPKVAKACPCFDVATWLKAEKI